MTPAQSYPTQLEQLLVPAYPTQSIQIINDGVSGETAEDGAQRLPSSLGSGTDFLLLLEGFNDISWKLLVRATPSSAAVSVTSIATDLRTMVRNAESRGVQVLLATLPPVTNAHEAANVGRRASTQALNAEIRRMSFQRPKSGVVDIYAALSVPGMIGSDGAHPTAAGYRRMAELFFQEIVTRFDITPRASAFRESPLGMSSHLGGAGVAPRVP